MMIEYLRGFILLGVIFVQVIKKLEKWIVPIGFQAHAGSSVTI